MCGHKRIDTMRNEVIWNKVGVTNIRDKMREDKMRESMLCWFGHVQRMLPTAPVRRCQSSDLGAFIRGKGIPKKSWMKVIR